MGQNYAQNYTNRPVSIYDTADLAKELLDIDLAPSKIDIGKLANEWLKEEEQFAKSMKDYYRICFAHPAVDAVILWGYWEGAMWMPASALYRKDWSLTPSGEAYRSLVLDEWWTDYEGKSDKNGMCIIPAYFGKHQVKVNGKMKEVDLSKKDKIIYVEIK